MTQVVSLRRHDTGTPWGFRLNGGQEFGMPLYVQKVTAGSIAHRAGMMPGDALVQIGRAPANGMTHDTAKMEIIRAGNEVDFVVQRGVVETVERGADMGDPMRPRAEVIGQPPAYKNLPPQDPSVQSRSFKLLQQQMAE